MSQKYGHCPVPSCERRLISGRHPHGLCPHHEELLDFLLFILPRIEAIPAQSRTGLVLPGDPEFSLKPEKVIKKEIEKHGSPSKTSELF